jgi:hypothetical protein
MAEKSVQEPTAASFYSKRDVFGEFLSRNWGVNIIDWQETMDEIEQLLRQLPLLETQDERIQFAQQLSRDSEWFASRLMARYVGINTNCEATALGPTPPMMSPVESATDVVSVVLPSLPVPAEDVPVEQIIEFRSSDDVQVALRRLRLWVRAIATSGKSAADLTLELQVLLDEYEQYMRLQRMKINRGILETLVTATLEVLEHLAHAKFASAADAIFAASRRRLQLLEAEMTAPGREVAYVSAARSRFAPGA